MRIKVWKPGEPGNPSTRNYYYQFFQRKKRYRGILDVRNAEQARGAAEQIWIDEWNKEKEPERVEPKPVRLFSEFAIKTYLPWSKSHKASYEDDVRITTMLTEIFKDKTLPEIKPAMVELFKSPASRTGQSSSYHQPRAFGFIQDLHRSYSTRRSRIESVPKRGAIRFG